jgi:acyl carrier protein
VALGEGGLGLDSIRLLEVVLACEDRFGVTLAVEEMKTGVPTLGDLVGLVEAALGRTA